MKVSLIELWGLGDAVMMTPMLQALRASNAETTVICKSGSIDLLRPSYPEVEYIPFDPPWTAFRGKYRLWLWPWRQIASVCRRLRLRRFDAIVSVRRDPRDHLLMWIIGAKRRLGFPSLLAKAMLTDLLPEPAERRPVSTDWQELQIRLLGGLEFWAPQLQASCYRLPNGFHSKRTVIGLHAGARIPVRRWSEKNFRDLFQRLREQYDFDFLLIPDVDGYGRVLEDIADLVYPSLSLEEMVGAIGACDLLVCNDSAPGHIADAEGVPVVTIFGPTDPIRFRPSSARNHVVIREICPFRPCFDYCHFPEPKCLTELAVADIWPEVITHIEHLLETGVLPLELRKGSLSK